MDHFEQRNRVRCRVPVRRVVLPARAVALPTRKHNLPRFAVVAAGVAIYGKSKRLQPKTVLDSSERLQTFNYSISLLNALHS